MVEVQMVRRMIKHALLIAPFLIIALWLVDGPTWALSGGIGLAMTLLNLVLAARIIGGIADKNPRLLLAAAMVAFSLGLALLTGIAFAVRALDFVYFPVTGFTLIGAHMILVLWEAAAAYKLNPKNSPVQPQKT